MNSIRFVSEEEYKAYVQETAVLYKSFVERLETLPQEEAIKLSYYFSLSNYLPLCASMTSH